MLPDPNADPLLSRVAQAAHEILLRSPACHDWDHTLRVWANARRIREIEGGNALVVHQTIIIHIGLQNLIEIGMIEDVRFAMPVDSPHDHTYQYYQKMDSRHIAL